MNIEAVEGNFKKNGIKCRWGAEIIEITFYTIL